MWGGGGGGYNLVRHKDVEGEVLQHFLTASDWSQKTKQGASYEAVITRRQDGLENT